MNSGGATILAGVVFLIIASRFIFWAIQKAERQSEYDSGWSWAYRQKFKGISEKCIKDYADHETEAGRGEHHFFLGVYGALEYMKKSQQEAASDDL